MKKKFKVVMLPTEKATSIAICNNDYLQDDTNNFKNYVQSCINRQHLYIISDDKIKEGDWVIHYVNQQPKLVENDKEAIVFTGGLTKKIVATTDKSIHINPQSSRIKDKFLPQLPESFIQAYIKAYNEGKPITEVDLELEQTIFTPEGFKQTITKEELKTRPNNTVIVHQSKMYSKDEVLNKLSYDKLREAFDSKSGMFLNKESAYAIYKWINDNL